MHINLESDYAIRIVQCLAEQSSRTHTSETDAPFLTARAIATATGVSSSFTLKILRKLVAEGIAVSYKGAGGGYELARPAASITLRQVIEAAEGPYQFSRCLSGTYDCNCPPDTCRFYAVFNEVSQLVSEKLDTVKFG